MAKIKRIKTLYNVFLGNAVGYSKIDLKEQWIKLGIIARRTLFNIPGQYRPIEKKLLKLYNKYRDRSKQYLLCHAPYKNLYFQMDGNVVTCCNNRFYSLGKYPESSLADIWTGEKINKLRNHIANNDLSLGCNFCYSCIKANNYRGMPAHAFDEFNANKDYPISLELELENTCNLECIMCCGPLSSTVRRNRDKLPPIPKIYDDNFVESLKTIIPKLERVKFIGGEPFLIEIYYKIWETILDINPQCVIELQTNATVLNNRIKDVLNRGNFRIGVSLDSLKKDVYENIRMNAHFEHVMENIEYFSNYSASKGYPFSVSVCPMRINWKEIPDLINFCNAKKANIYFNTVIYPNYLAICSLDSTEMKKIKEYYAHTKLNNQSSLYKVNYERFKHLANQINLWYNEAISRELNNSSHIKSFEKHPEEKLINKLLEYIYNYINVIDREQDIEMIRSKLKNILTKIELEQTKLNVINTLYNLPADLIYDLLTNDSYGMMKSIIKEYIDNSNASQGAGYSISYQS